MKKLILLFIFYYTTSINAQSIEIIHQSKEKNDNVVGNSIYLENKKDTARGRYVATFKVSCLHHPVYITSVLNLLKIKVKEVGANSFFLDSFTEADSMFDIRIKAYFTFTKAYKENEENKIKNKTIVFNLFKLEGFYQSFFLNDSVFKFPTSSYFEVPFTSNNKQTIKVCNKVGISLGEKDSGDILLALQGDIGSLAGLLANLKESIQLRNKPNSTATFVGIYKEPLIKLENIDDVQKNQYFDCGSGKFSYQAGRLLMELFKPAP